MFQESGIEQLKRIYSLLDLMTEFSENLGSYDLHESSLIKTITFHITYLEVRNSQVIH